MIIRFSQDELHKLSIRQIDRGVLSETYRRERQGVWDIKLAAARAEGRDLWNGEVYTIENIIQYDEDCIVIEMSSCEYKDIVLQTEKGVEAIVKQYGTDYLLRFVTVDCIPITRDGRFVFGIRGGKTIVGTGALGLIGGTLNKDEMSVERFSDISAFMQREIQEETNLPCAAETLALFSLNFFGGKYEFLFSLRVPVHSNEIAGMHKTGEFSQLIAMGLAETISTQRYGVDAFRYCRNYLPRLARWCGMASLPRACIGPQCWG